MSKGDATLSVATREGKKKMELDTDNLEVIVLESDGKRLEEIVGPPQYGHGMGGWRSRLLQYVDYKGDAIPISEQEAQERYSSGRGVAGVFVKSYGSASGLGVRAGRPNVPSPVFQSVMVWVEGIVAKRGNTPEYSSGEGLPFSLNYFALEGGHLIKSQTYEEWKASNRGKNA